MKQLYDKLQILEPEGVCFDEGERLAAIVRPLLCWFDEQARILPWREDPQPYRVWISEIMLQQTRVEAVKPYFERFMAELPGIVELSEVSDDQLLKLWEGLGYYNRAKNLKKAAGEILENYGGQLPASYEELQKLPGIGSYTAGAIASIAYGIPAPAVDGNVLRVISRVLASRRDILKQQTKRWMEEAVLKVMPDHHSSHFNQGLIEVGAIVCVPNGQPKCNICPLNSLCLARKQGLISEIPVKTPKKQRKIEQKTIGIIQFEDTLALCKRKDTGLLASMYEFPNVDGCLTAAEAARAFNLLDSDMLSVEKLPPAKHMFSHIEWHMTAYQIRLGSEIPKSFIAAHIEELEHNYPLPNAFSAFRKTLYQAAAHRHK